MRFWILFLMLFFAASGYAAAQKTLSAPQDQAACEKSGGAWGKYGMAQKEGCDKPTLDAGHSCNSSRECESGLCVLDNTAPKGTLGGKCFGRTMTFGCHKLFEKEQAARGEFMSICRD